ncbi:MAG: DNA cytosine methyltransferase [Halothiobacillaceae bacterium]
MHRSGLLRSTPSVAQYCESGSQACIAGERSGLFREVMRAIDDIRPTWVFLENSPRIRTRGRHIVIGELVARGYSWRDGVLGAADVGAPHKRDRWWCLARRADADCLRELQSQGIKRDERGRAGDMGEAVADAYRQPGGQGRPDHAEERARGRDADRGGKREDVSDANGVRSGQFRRPASGPGAALAPEHGAPWQLADAAGQRLEEPQPGEEGDEQQAATGADRRLGWWGAEPAVGRVVDGLAAAALCNYRGGAYRAAHEKKISWHQAAAICFRSKQIKALGNGQVPLCAAVAWRLLGGP